MKAGHRQTRTHGDTRSGAATQFAALKVLGGTETGRNIDRLRHQKFIAALDTVERQLPEGREANVVLDNDST
ncbi:MAG: hypothetical protein OXN84_04070 [Albidovulum sp.]|nr:hypothetical protein [Albidovulum sp.]